MDPHSARSAILAQLLEKPDGVLEELALQHRVSLRFVLDLLPADAVRSVPGSHFAEIWRDVTLWGVVMFLVHSKDGVFEIKTALPPGTEGRGYFNVHGDAPLGGHIQIGRCAAIYFVDHLFFGRRSCSLQFVNPEGEAMFKIFAARDENGALSVEQLARFERLRETSTGASAL